MRDGNDPPADDAAIEATTRRLFPDAEAGSVQAYRNAQKLALAAAKEVEDYCNNPVKYCQERGCGIGVGFRSHPVHAAVNSWYKAVHETDIPVNGGSDFLDAWAHFVQHSEFTDRVPLARQEGGRIVEMLRNNWMDGGFGPASDQRIVVAKSKRVTLYEPNRIAAIDGRTKGQLTPAQFEIIQKLIEERPRRLSKDELNGDKTDNGARILQNLVKSDPAWAAVISMAEKRGTGYSIE